jgi:hypothetical protein
MDEELDIHKGRQHHDPSRGLWRPADELPIDPVAVRDEGNAIRPYRWCGFCGSIHPLDILGLGPIQGVSLADMKYGYPHKLYIDAIHPLAGQEVQMGGKWEDGQIVEPIMGRLRQLHIKFYLNHLHALDDDELAEVSGTLVASGFDWRFVRDSSGIRLVEAD